MILSRRRSAAPTPATEPAGRVVVVTDSTSGVTGPAVTGVVVIGDASQPSSHSGGVVVVPLHVNSADGSWTPGSDVTPDDVVARVAAGEALTTSQPTPAAFAGAYRAAAETGAPGVVAVHLSGELSGTVGVARFAAARAMLPVRVVDSRTAAGCLRFAVEAAARCAESGADLEHVAARAQEVAAASRGFFLVDSLEHLRRGGRLSPTAAALGSALGLKPILEMRGGRIETIAKARSRRSALEKLGDLALAHAATAGTPAVAVHHFGAPERASELAERLEATLEVDVAVTPLSPVLGGHLGPGALAVAVADLGDHSH